MTTLYVFDCENSHVATIEGEDNNVCEGVFKKHYDINDYSATYTPAFGFGMEESDDATQINADVQASLDMIPEANREQIDDWKSRLPSDLKFGTFVAFFDINGKYYRYGAWNTAGDWWLAWNTEEEFKQQLDSCVGDDE